MQNKDPLKGLAEETERHARLSEQLRSAQAVTSIHDRAFMQAAREAQAHAKMIEAVNGPALKFAREVQAHAKMIEAVNGPRWMRDLQQLTQGYDAGIMRFAREAQEQMRFLQESGAFKFAKEAQAATRRLEEAGIMKTLRDVETQRQLVEATSGFAQIAQTVRNMLVEPAILKMMREVSETTALYRRLNLDIAQIAATMPHLAAEGVSGATAELEAIEANIVAPPAQRDSKAVAESFQRLIHTLEKLLDGVSSPVERKAILKFLGWVIPIILMLWLAHIQHEDSVENQKSSDRNAAIAHQDSENVQKAIAKLAERYGSAQAQDENVQYYDVVRLVPLCADRKLSGANHFVLIPGSTVQLTKRGGKWIEVCAIVQSGGTAKGWVLKKYLKRQKH